MNYHIVFSELLSSNLTNWIWRKILYYGQNVVILAHINLKILKISMKIFHKWHIKNNKEKKTAVEHTHYEEDGATRWYRVHHRSKALKHWVCGEISFNWVQFLHIFSPYLQAALLRHTRSNSTHVLNTEDCYPYLQNDAMKENWWE